jgi:hypothetical protein
MSSIPRRIFATALVVFCCLPWQARAQSHYPSQPIKLIVPYAPGGVPDTTARLLAQRLQDRVDQTVVVENRAGGNGGVAAAVIAAAPADGYTLLVVDTTLLSVSPLFISQLSYNPQKDFSTDRRTVAHATFSCGERWYQAAISSDPPRYARGALNLLASCKRSHDAEEQSVFEGAAHRAGHLIDLHTRQSNDFRPFF